MDTNKQQPNAINDCENEREMSDMESTIDIDELIFNLEGTLAENEQLRADNHALKELNDLLCASDTGAEIYKLKQLFTNAENQKHHYQALANKFKWYEKIIKDVAKELNTNDYKTLVGVVRGLKSTFEFNQ